MNVILVVDIGTSSMRGVLYDADGQLCHIIQVAHGPEFLENGHVEQDPRQFADGLFRISTEAALWAESNGAEIGAISVTSQRSSIIPVDAEGNALHPAIMWQDRRSQEICTELAPHADLAYERTGVRINPVFAAPKTAWLKRHRRDLYDRAHKILVIPDYVVFLMTGLFVTDYTYGSRTALMNIREQRWDDDMLRLFDIDREKLCTLVPQGTVLGRTTKAFAAKTGMRSGVPVVSAGGDQQCGALGAGVIDSGSVQVTTGTGSFIIASTDAPHLDDRKRMICNVSAVRGKYILESSILTSSTVYNWFHAQFYGTGAERPSIADSADREAAASPIGSNGVLLLPHFQGRGSPDWNGAAKGLFFNLTLGTKRGDMARAILEGIAAEVAGNLEIMRDAMGCITRVTASGGMTKCALFNHIQADTYGHAVHLPANRETTSLGAWISAAVAIGWFKDCRAAYDRAVEGTEATVFVPDMENHEIHERLNDRRARLYECIRAGGMYELFQ